MRKTVILALSCHCGALMFVANSSAANAADSFKSVDFNLYQSVGYREDTFKWNKAGNNAGTDPNILSELSWDNLSITQFKIGGDLLLDERLYIRASVSLGKASSGDNQDSDYDGDNRTLEWSRTNNDAKNSSVVDSSIALGFKFKVPGGIGGREVYFVPLIGYSRHAQSLRLTDGYQTISKKSVLTGATPAPVGPFSLSLNSLQESTWRGQWVGIDMFAQVHERVLLRLYIERHDASYAADLNWNLRGDLAHPVSFAQRANGTGTVVGADLKYQYAEGYSFTASLTRQEWSTESGIDKTYFANGDTTSQQLNEVEWQSWSAMVGFEYRI
ncbi:MAG: hypothetical protein GXP10_00305 [Gammaproteobacteria bacterium]|nr:hypothetical protein [Gammaproteobacteria bacterium]